MNELQERSRFLELRRLSLLAHKRFSTRQRVDGMLAGRHVSQRSGGAGEFSDFREYSAGEDLRRLDWKVLGRTGRAYVKIYKDENNLVCTPVIDASGSMNFGGGASGERGTKLEYAQYLATALSHLIGLQRDQVGLAVIADGLQEHFKPGASQKHVLALQEAIEKIETQPKSDLAGGLGELFPQSGHRGVLLVMSDFLVDDTDALFAQLRLYRQRQWEVIALHLIDPEEESLPEGVAFRFDGLEGEASVRCAPDRIRDAYRQKFEAHCAVVRSQALAIGADYRRVSTAVPYIETLNQFLIDRAG